MDLQIEPVTVAEDAGASTFTLRAMPQGGAAFAARSLPKFNGVLPAATVVLVHRDVLTVALDPADLTAGTFGVTVIDRDTRDTLAHGATLDVTAAP